MIGLDLRQFFALALKFESPSLQYFVFSKYTVVHKKGATLIFTVTLANLDRFQEFATGRGDKTGSGGWKSPSGVQGQSPSGCLGAKPQKPETNANFQLRRGDVHPCPLATPLAETQGRLCQNCRAKLCIMLGSDTTLA